MPSIVSVGLATAQGGVAEILAGSPPLPPAPLPWPADRRTFSTVCRPALGIAPALEGIERWRALARRALAECCGKSPPPPGTPLVVASCNGAAGSFEAGGWSRAFDVTGGLGVPPWDGVRRPVVSAACASGLHALFLARRLLDAGAEEVVVLAADVLSVASHDNFEVLRILSPDAQPPWQPRTEGFLAGEAAVALRLRRGGPGPYLIGPVLSHDLDGAGGLGRTLAALAPDGVELILGQGTGPMDVDAVELAALRRAVPDTVPITTPLFHFGHTLGASGLLSLALAFLAREQLLAALALPSSKAPDGRRLADRPAIATGDVLVVCRALGGACAACVLSDEDRELLPPPVDRWAEPVAPGPLHHPSLRRLAAEALDHRPETPPELLAVHLAEPLTPPERAVLGGRLLPSAVLEITPGFTALLVARAWGYAGPALCLVGGREPPSLLLPTPSGGNVIYISSEIRPEGHHVDWNR